MKAGEVRESLNTDTKQDILGWNPSGDILDYIKNKLVDENQRHSKTIITRDLSADGWKMLVCCIMLNLTNRKQVDRVRHKLFKKYQQMKFIGDYEELSELLTPLD